MPVAVNRIPPDSLLIGNFARARLRSAGGVDELCGSSGIQTIMEQTGSINYWVRVPASVYNRLADEPIRVEMEHSLTLMTLSGSASLPAAGGEVRTNLGRCATRIREGSSAIDVSCVSPGRGLDCAFLALEHPASGSRNPQVGSCVPEYSPMDLSFGMDSLSRLNYEVPFGDPGRPNNYAIQAPMLPESRVTIRAYGPRVHFRRTATVDGIRMREWAAP
jgi:hypothetical protein